MQNHTQVSRPALASERAVLLLERAATIYQKNLAETPEGGAYLKMRGITDAALWGRHRLGYSNGKLTGLLPRHGAIWDELKELGLLRPDGQERFAGCVIFPVIDAEGNLTAIYGRHTEEKDESYVCLPGRPGGLWNAVALKAYAHIVLVRSSLDGLSVEMAGYQNVIGIPGPTGLNTGDVAMLTSYGLQRITLLFNGNEAGRTAAGKLQTLLSPFNCEQREVPQDHEPNSYLIAHGPEALAQLLVDGRRTQPATGPVQAAHPACSPSPEALPSSLGCVIMKSGDWRKGRVNSRLP